MTCFRQNKTYIPLLLFVNYRGSDHFQQCTKTGLTIHQSRYKNETRHGDPLFLLHFFDVLDVDNHLAKFQIKSIATSYSGE